MTDTHCHLASQRYSPEEIPSLLARAAAAGVTRVISLSTEPADLAANLALAEAHPAVFACHGIHPCDAHLAPDDLPALLNPYLSHPKTVAVGEAGLDYYHPAPEGWTEETFHARQRDLLRQQFQLAADHGLNIAIHTRDRVGDASFQDALTIYRDFHRTVRAVFHCFPGPAAAMKSVLDLGGFLSFTGNVTFKNAASVAEAATLCPLDRLMLETDAPYLAPVPHRGQKNEPAHVSLVAKKIALLRDIPLSSLLEQTETNVATFFRLPADPNEIG